MAYYNPKRVDFAPNLGLIQSSGAVGNYLQNWSNNLTAQENHNQARQDKLDFQTWQKNRALVQDEQWNKAFEAGREDRVEDVNHRNNVFNHTKDQAGTQNQHNQSILALKQDSLNHAKTTQERQAELLAQQIAEERRAKEVRGKYQYETNPVIQEIFQKLNIGNDTYLSENPRVANATWGEDRPDVPPREITKQAPDAETLRAIGAGLGDIQQGGRTNDPLAKQRATWQEFYDNGLTKLPFAQWMEETGGGDIKIRQNNLTTANNMAREQLSALSELTNLLIGNYDPKNHGPIDGAARGLQNFMPFLHTQKSAQLQNNINAIQLAYARALSGARPTQDIIRKAEAMVGGSVGSEAGQAAKYKEILRSSILKIEETARQIDNNGGDASHIHAELDKYRDTLQRLEPWRGNTSPQRYLQGENFQGVRPMFDDSDPATMTDDEIRQALGLGRQ